MPLPVSNRKLRTLRQIKELACARRADENHAHSIAWVYRLYAAFLLLELPDAFLEVGDLRFEVVHGLIGNGSHVEAGKLEGSLTKARENFITSRGAL